jgi:nucleotide-binding universal stress UspA family protein
VSEHRSALYSIRFLGHFFTSGKEGLRITLFIDTPKTHPRTSEQGEKSSSAVQTALREARKELVRVGFAEEMIDTKTHRQQLSTAMDIIREGERGGYDAVALGKGAVSRLEEFLERSTSKEMLEKALDFPLWICRPPKQEGKGVLLCLDGSAASYRMADHVGRMLQLEPEQRITLFRATEEPGAAKSEPLERARNILRSRGIPQDRMITEIVESSTPGRTIADKAKRDRHAVVAVGRTGKGAGLVGELFLGSTSMTLYRELSECALWVCR